MPGPRPVMVTSTAGTARRSRRWAGSPRRTGPSPRARSGCGRSGAGSDGGGRELSPAQRKIAFVLVVLVFAALGFALLRSTTRSPARAGAAPPAPGPSAPAAPAPSASPSASAPAGAPGTGAPPPSGPAEPDIYQWLPFTQPELGAAARTVVSFADHYGTYSYTENAASYLAPMRSLITSQLGQLLAQAYSTPGVASMRVSRRQVSSGTAVISSLRAFGPSSLTFVVAITQRITGRQGSGQSTADYSVTASGGGTSWQVSDIELASVGNS
jgi:hypothetical protein